MKGENKIKSLPVKYKNVKKNLLENLELAIVP